MAYVYEDPDTPEEVYISDLAGQDARKISVANAEYHPAELGKTELIRWESKDGLEIEGLLTYPAGYQDDTRYPVVLLIHGGPGGVFTKNFTGQPGIYMVQLFAQEGYLVLRPNPRGSTGYGKDFRYANVKDWGYGDFQDLMTGVDHVLDLGIADPGRQYVMGWSYGGYMTSWTVTQTDRFRAASMGAGLPDLISMVTTTDIPDYLVAHMGGTEFWEDYEAYERHSATFHIANVTTPTQILHGAQDVRVPTSQGTEFYVALKRMGVETEMTLYPRTPHGPREPKLLMDVSPRILQWFGKFQD
jgi:dipeptidyl aminopeptidase/acylaminoacyl peptidase